MLARTWRRPTGRVIFAGTLTTVLAFVVAGAGFQVSQSRVMPRGFVSLVPACACGRHTELDEFSLRTGRRLRKLAQIMVPAGEQLATPAAQADGRLLLTFTRGAVCSVSGYMECPKLVAGSCRNTVESLIPGQTIPRILFTFPGSQEIADAVPSPGGSRVAFSSQPCTAETGTTGLFIRDLASRREHPVLRSNNPCDWFGRAAWNPSGTKLVFVFARAYGRASGGIVSFCPGARERLAVASANSSSSSRVLALIAPDRGCAFASAAFDARGIAAAEGCKRGGPPGVSSTVLGNAYLLQFDRNDHLVTRIALKRHLEGALVATEPHTGKLLVTQDQPANEGPEFDWVWEFDGTRLRAISHYRAFDAEQVIAVPW